MKLTALFAAAAALAFTLSPTAEAARDGLRSKKTVLKGGLIRAGGAGGQNSMTTATVKQLCEEGVSVAYYLYPSVNFTNKGTHACSKGSIEYKGAGFSSASAVRPILTDVANAINSGSGPVLVHCWNGWHAAGEVSAYALMQFCDWSGDRAADYWASNIADKGSLGKYQGLMNRIRRFQPIGGLRISDSAKSRVCP